MSRVAVVLAAAAVLAFPAGALGSGSDAPAAADTVTVSGVGTVRSIPDRAALTAGIETLGDTAAQALSRNAVVARRVIAALRRAGAKDVTTAWVSLSPHVLPDGTRSGFVAANSVSATFRLGNAGPAIDAAVKAGANTVQGPSFVVSQHEALYLRALDAAMANARGRAMRIARAAGRSLGRIVMVAEASAGMGPVPVYAKLTMDAASTPIVAGEQDTTASVTVTFALR